jgi:dihydrofolate synthase/folylpolyglutamate synthase
MQYKHTLDYINSKLPMYHKIGEVAYKKDLQNILALCQSIGNPHINFSTIHVGGTNGKGSVSHMLTAICRAAKLKTGLYTSPHYKDFRERIRVNNKKIRKKEVVEFIENYKKTIEEIQPSFFEVCVAMAFHHFAQKKVDIAIIEVGLGGRLDSTNIIQPLASVITNISFDHMNLLGNTIPQIASEKAGIIKNNTPVIIGETHPESQNVFIRKATDCNAPIFFADQNIQTRAIIESVSENNTTYELSTSNLTTTLTLNAAGPYQQKNLITALQTAITLKLGTRNAQPPLNKPKLPAFQENSLPPAVIHGLSNMAQYTTLMGRWQIISENPRIICDSAHNPAGLEIIFNKIPLLTHHKLHIVIGFVNDKDLSGALQKFPTNATYYFAKANIPRGMPANQLKKAAVKFNLQGKACRSVRNALKTAKMNAQPDDLILVTGSIFVVAEAI